MNFIGFGPIGPFPMAFQDIIHEQYRQKFYENRLQSMESANDLHRARRSTHGAAQ